MFGLNRLKVSLSFSASKNVLTVIDIERFNELVESCQSLPSDVKVKVSNHAKAIFKEGCLKGDIFNLAEYIINNGIDKKYSAHES
ncbi:hypothetical protein [Francisella orientalis]|uniref:Uncharacterized protein n=1 Tax=Francisella orientalis TaxID=299583 RepID=A0AAP6X559_9GAMM|nr:hypothetical protein [Francisella orientalis]AFJ42593.1 hypothetical protein OOM_0019 [Francisella orientalis str. Toba 04]AHB99044.1 hypothetical protein M973_00475 [Francisella orientalis LADL 07-285A]AKN84844.1 hypothetical protein FNO12_0020 [Francisella orientalis FNO12]AKN86382.1 Hypothetical protein FNO24_0020 [Francisella orientalis FNO24]AKN87920.1 Hypothetical protein FNO190_0020 [Francisella orientalis]